MAIPNSSLSSGAQATERTRQRSGRFQISESAAVEVRDERSTEEMITKLQSLICSESPRHAERVIIDAHLLLESSTTVAFTGRADLLIKACVYLFNVGYTKEGISLGHEIAGIAAALNQIYVLRRINNTLGGQYADLSDYPASMECLQTALTLSAQIGNPTIEAACLSNVVTVMQDMGHYRQAISLAQTVLKLEDDSDIARNLKLQCSASGLFAAHRIGNNEAALQFLQEGETQLPFASGTIVRAFFEKNRALYLIDSEQVDLAVELVENSIRSTSSVDNPRLKILWSIPVSLCEWATGRKDGARQRLKEMYAQSKESRLYHNLVLQTLIKVYSDASDAEQAAEGLEYARELVGYTTSVKRAKFYRQLTAKIVVDRERNADHIATQADPFATVRDWLTATNVECSNGSEPGRKELAKHEELTAIHEDMAKLRAASLRREIRTDAVDTAENWAIAAELFDDETGQHCYRVGHLAGMLAREIGMNDTFCVQVEHAARLHDIGKIAVNEVILLKPGPLDAAEMAAMRLHTEVGGQMLAGSDDPTLKMASEIARYHHEWWNGGGYPKRLSGREIPISARVCAFADVYDALTHARAYKVAWTHERALEEILRLRGVQFDPDLMDPFVKVLDRYLADLDANAIPGFADMNTNALISSRRKLMETIAAGNK